MSPIAGAVELQRRLAETYKHESDIDAAGSDIHLPSGSFTFVTVPDHFRALLPLAVVQYPNDHRAQYEFVESLAPAYDSFMREALFAIREAGAATDQSIKVCILDLAKLTDGVRKQTEGAFVVSLNEGDLWADFRLGLSRLFSVGGDMFFTHTSRPGCDAIDEQLRSLKEKMSSAGAAEVVLVDDHAFSGKTMESVVSLLHQQGIPVRSVATYTRVNSLAALERTGIKVYPVKSFNGEGVLERADLVEPRYFLIGSAGCVVELPNNKLARAPYVLPFGSPSERASIPRSEAGFFSRRIISLNQDFFRAWAETMEREPLVRDLDPLFQGLAEFHGFDSETSVRTMLSACSERLEDRVGRRVPLEKVQSKLRPLGLPRDIVFLDINDTILKTGDSHVNVLATEQLKRRIRKLQDLGVHVGLCSDSPLPQMEKFAEGFGIKGPLIAENGCIIHNDGHHTVLRRLDDIEGIRERIKTVASRLQRERAVDRVAVEFGGPSTPIESGSYCFGANRIASVSVFGDKTLIEALRREFEPDAKRFGIDANPEAGTYGFFAVHPSAVHTGKAETLRMLSNFGLRITIIGNSPTDFVEPGDGVDVGMVGNHMLSPDKLAQCRYRTSVNLTLGVCDILRQIEKDRQKRAHS